MPVRSPLPNDTRSRVADWLEVIVLTGSRGVATRSEVLGLYDLLGDETHEVEVDEVTGEGLETEILEDQRISIVDEILEELSHRYNVLGSFYPFSIEVRGQNWRLVRSQPDGADVLSIAAQCCYIFCLLTSAIRDSRIHGAALGPLERQMAVHFQELASDAAAQVINGVSVSFGWPRKEGTQFKPALHAVSQQMKLGIPLDTIPLWASGKEKDSGIDVIAWRDFRDARPGKIVLFGQVASGNNWTDKAVTADTPRFLAWFSQHPTKYFIPAIFIPFPQHHECAGRASSAFEDVAAAQAWMREQEFGLVIDRLRIVEAVAKQLTDAAAAGANGATTAHTTLDAVNTWINSALTVARAAA